MMGKSRTRRPEERETHRLRGLPGDCATEGRPGASGLKTAARPRRLARAGPLQPESVRIVRGGAPRRVAGGRPGGTKVVPRRNPSVLLDGRVFVSGDRRDWATQISMRREVFASLGEDELGWACIGPVLLSVRGRDAGAKHDVYSQLTAGQRALFMFYAYYNHAHSSIAEFCWWTDHYLAHPGMWAEIKAGLRYLGDHSLLRLLQKAEASAGGALSPGDSDAVAALSQLYAEFVDVAEQSVRRIGARIRGNPEEFVRLSDSGQCGRQPEQ